jgi:outer membrane protein assembly factor BamA
VRASDLRLILPLLAWLCLTGAVRPAPDVTGDETAAVEAVRSSLAGRAKATPTVWVRRAWSALEAGGWPWARLRADTLSAGEAWTLEIDAGPRSRVGALEVRGPDPEVIRIWREGSGLSVGDPLSPAGFQEQLDRGLRAVSDEGYPLASVSVVAQQANAETGEIALTLLVRPGPRARIREVNVVGATRTRPDVLARLSGLEPGQWVEEGRLAVARERLRARPGLVTDVGEIEIVRVPGVPEEVDVRIVVEQDPRSGSFSGALGARRDDGGKTELSGSVELSLGDLFGTARSFRGRWSDDGRGRSYLDLAWGEPMLLGTGLDLGASVGQRHEDDAFDMVLADLALVLPARPGLQLGVTGGLDRTTFIGDEGRTRRRNRGGVNIGMQFRRGLGAGAFGQFSTAVQAAFVSDRRRDPETGDSAQASVRQTLIEAEGRVGWAFSRTVALEARGAWRSTENAPLPLPRSEQWGIGGATSVRGNAEDRYFGERVAWGGIETVFGPAGRGQAYLFFDAGWVRTTSEVDGVTGSEENRLTGFGLGVRAPTALGSIDLSLGFADELNFDDGKLHVALVQAF